MIVIAKVLMFIFFGLRKNIRIFCFYFFVVSGISQLAFVLVQNKATCTLKIEKKAPRQTDVGLGCEEKKNCNVFRNKK